MRELNGMDGECALWRKSGELRRILAKIFAAPVANFAASAANFAVSVANFAVFAVNFTMFAGEAFAKRIMANCGELWRI